MTTLRRRTGAPLVAFAAVAAITACAAGSGADAGAGVSLGSRWPASPSGDVIGSGTVLDDGAGAQLCLGGVLDSSPPQCSGIPLRGWDWEGLDGWEQADDVRWGAYAVQGDYDGETLTVGAPPILLALYDPMALEDPTGGVPGDTTEPELLRVQELLPNRLGAEFLSAGVREGYVWVDVVWDDGTLQEDADTEFGDDVVIVRSALQPVG